MWGIPPTNNKFIYYLYKKYNKVYKYRMAYCPLCNRKFMDRRGLHGHFRFVHGIEYGSNRPAKISVLTEAIRKNIEIGKMVRREDKIRQVQEERMWSVEGQNKKGYISGEVIWK